MARIEISYDEYKGLKQQIKQFSDEIAKLNEKNYAINENYEKYENIIYSLINSTLTDRMFRWKEISDDVIEKIKSIK